MYKSRMSKEEFDKKYVGEKLVVNCKTEKLADEFLMEADSHGYEWCTSNSYINNSKFYTARNKEGVCYDLRKGDRGSLEQCIDNNYTIINFEGFCDFTRDMLKSWDLVELRNGNRVFVSLEIGILHSVDETNDWLPLNRYKNDLTYRDYSVEFDIMKIYRFKTNNSFCFDIADSRFSELIWERTEESEQDKINRLQKEENVKRKENILKQIELLRIEAEGIEV